MKFHHSLLAPIQIVFALGAFTVPLACEVIDDLDTELGIDNDDRKGGLNIPDGLASSEPSLSDKGGYTIELVTWDKAEPLDKVAVIRAFEGAYTVAYWPLGIRLDDKLVTPPDVTFHKDAGQILTVKSRRKTDLHDGIHQFIPGDGKFKVDGIQLRSLSPSVVIKEDTIQLRLVPVSFVSTNEEKTQWFKSNLKIFADDVELMKRFEKVGPPIHRYPIWKLTMYLPAGQLYKSSWGSFQVTQQGEIQPIRMGPTVSLEGLTFRHVQQALNGPSSSDSFFVRHGETNSACSAPYLWGKDNPTVVCLDSASGKGKPEVQVSSLIRPWEKVILNVEPGEVPTAAAASFAQEGLVSVAYQCSLPSQWPAGPAVVEIKHGGVITSRSVVVVSSKPQPHLFTRLPRSAYTTREQIEVRIVLPNSGPAQLFLQSVPDAESQPEADSPNAVQVGNFATAEHTLIASVDCSGFEPGRYLLFARQGGHLSNVLTVTLHHHVRQSNLLVSNTTICTGGWDTLPEWKSPSRQGAMGVEMLTRAGGHNGHAFPYEPRLDPSLAQALEAKGLPTDYALIPAEGALFLDECVRNGVGYIDYISTYKGWYLEGLSVHHSFTPDVNRWIRREQIMFGAGADYPSLWGVNYTWFPRLFGYSEGGVDTDIRKGDRNRALFEDLKKKGLQPISSEEHQFQYRNANSNEPDVKAMLDALKKRQRDLVSGYSDAFYDNFKRYADAIKEVRPDGLAVAFENAGHDGCTGGNYLPKFYGGLTTATMEAYTDHGDWALEPGFTTDWVRAAMKAAPDRQRPFWLAAEWLAPPPNRFGYMLQAVARRVEGTSYPFPDTWTNRMDGVVGNIVTFLKGYGSVQPFVEVEPDIAILCSFEQMAVSGRAIYDYHACYYELTRAQYPPQCIYQETVARGGLKDSGIKILFIIKQTMPLPEDVVVQIKEFQQSGGSVVMDSETTVPMPGAHRLSYSSKNIWQEGMGGFEQPHRLALWNQYLSHREELRNLLQEKVQPYAQCDDERVITSTLDGGDVRYVFAINDKFDPDKPESQLHVWIRAREIPMRLRDENAAVYQLNDFGRLEGKAENGRLRIDLDLFDQPGLILAALPEPILAITTNAPETLTAGNECLINAQLIGQSGKPFKGPTPARFQLKTPEGKVAQTLYRAAGNEDAAYFKFGVNCQQGDWQLETTDLVSGVKSTANIAVKSGVPAIVVKEPLRVVLPRKEATEKFLHSKEEKLIFVEESQQHLTKLAQLLGIAIRDAGGQARIVQVTPSSFGEVYMRWYPTVVEEEQYREIDAGDLIGVRKDMKSYIDPNTRGHVPSLGGYAGISPKFIVHHPNIVFGGGKLADSLNEIIPYRSTKNDPGPGNAVLALAFSAFEANKHSLAIMASDEAGFSRGVETAIEILKNGAGAQRPIENAKTASEPLPFLLLPDSPHYSGATSMAPTKPVKSQTPWRVTSNVTNAQPHAIAKQFRGFFASLVASNTKGAFLLRPGLGKERILISPEGKVAGTFEAPKDTFRTLISEDAQSVFHALTNSNSTEWMRGFQTRERLVVSSNPSGVISAVTPLWPQPGNDYCEHFTMVSSNYFCLNPDGRTLYRSREGGLTAGPIEGPYRMLNLSRNFRHYRETHSPDWPMAMSLSEDGKTLVMSCWGHPTGANMAQPFPIAMSPELVAVDTQTLKMKWKIVPPSVNTWGHAPMRDCLQINSDGSRVGLVDGRSQLYVYDGAGKLAWHKSLIEKAPSQDAWNVDANAASRIQMGEDGKTLLVLFSEKGELIHVREGAESVKFETLDYAMAPDGRFCLMYDDRVQAYSKEAEPLWSISLEGSASLGGLGKNGIAVIHPNLDVAMHSWDGKERWRLTGVEVAKAARAAGPLTFTDKTTVARNTPPWPEDTLQNLKDHCSAKLLKEIKGQTGDQAVTKGSGFNVHLAYRKPDSNPPLSMTLSDGRHKEKFILDLPAPLGRTQDIAWPNRGKPLTVSLEAGEGIEISSFQIWDYKWPSKNLVYVRPAGASELAESIGLGEGAEAEFEESDVEEDIEGTGVSGLPKDAKIYVHNPDPDYVAGTYLPAGDNPLKALNGKYYSEEKYSNWNTTKSVQAVRGLWLEVDLTRESKFDLFAYYSHCNKQSELVQSIGFMSNDNETERGFALAINNDQFFRLLYTPGCVARKVQMNLGEVRHSYGASEIEVYKSKK